MFFLGIKKYLKYKDKIDWSIFFYFEFKDFYKNMKCSSGYIVKGFLIED